TRGWDSRVALPKICSVSVPVEAATAMAVPSLKWKETSLLSRQVALVMVFPIISFNRLCVHRDICYYQSFLFSLLTTPFIILLSDEYLVNYSFSPRTVKAPLLFCKLGHGTSGPARRSFLY